MPKLIDLYLAGKLKLDELVTKFYTLEEINTAYKDLIDGKLARGIIRFVA
jgi:S-(hydroxymethyl)glutathione dehydrogenase/alcohol dehydrogenase